MLEQHIAERLRGAGFSAPSDKGRWIKGSPGFAHTWLPDPSIAELIGILPIEVEDESLQICFERDGRVEAGYHTYGWDSESVSVICGSTLEALAELWLKLKENNLI